MCSEKDINSKTTSNIRTQTNKHIYTFNIHSENINPVIYLPLDDNEIIYFTIQTNLFTGERFIIKAGSLKVFLRKRGISLRRKSKTQINTIFISCALPLTVINTLFNSNTKLPCYFQSGKRYQIKCET